MSFIEALGVGTLFYIGFFLWAFLWWKAGTVDMELWQIAVGCLAVFPVGFFAALGFGG